MEIPNTPRVEPTTKSAGTVEDFSLKANQIEISLRPVNIGTNQIQSLLREYSSDTRYDMPILSTLEEVRRRDKQALEFLSNNDDRAKKIFFEKIDEQWILLESFLDGDQSPIAKNLKRMLPHVHSYSQQKKESSQRSQDYEKAGESGTPGIDWSFFDKSVIRVIGKKLTGLIRNDRDIFQNKSNGISQESFEKTSGFVSELKSYNLLPLFTGTLLHLDFVKGGSEAMGKLWKEKYNADLLVHNEAAAKILEGDNTLENLNLLQNANVELSSPETATLYSFARKLIEFHGLVGQKIRGEVTPFAFEGLTGWIKDNFDSLESSIKKLSHGKVDRNNLPDFLANCYHTINLIDTSAVKEGLYTESLHQEFITFRDQLSKVITPNEKNEFETSWNDVFEKEITNFQKESEPREYAQRRFLADKLSRLRKSKIQNEDAKDQIEKFIFSLPTPIVTSYLDLLKNCQQWYTENATSDLPIENQAKLIFLASRIASQNGIDVSKNYHINFGSLMHTLRPDGNKDRARVQVFDKYLNKITWEDLQDNDFAKKLLGQPNKGIASTTATLGSDHALNVDFTFPDDARAVCAAINLLINKRNDPAKQHLLRELEVVFGLSNGGLDRGLEQEEYMEHMNKSMKDKKDNIVTFIEDIPIPEGEMRNVLSIGAGTGELEDIIIKLLPNTRVYTEDYSDVMIEGLKKKAQILEGRRKLGEHTGELIPLLADATKTPLPSESLDVAMACSVVHEITSSKDDYTLGKTTKKIYQELARLLKPGGRRLILRDFMQPENPEEIVAVEIDEAKKDNEMDPLEFVDKFSKEFMGGRLKEIRNQVVELKEKDLWKKGARINMKASDALEFAVHYSWAESLDKEIEEKYAYLPVKEYAKFIKETVEEVGYKVKIIAAYSYLQPEYADHILGRLNFYNQKNEPIGLPPFTGIVVIEKES